MARIELLKRNDGLLSSNCYVLFSGDEVCVIDPSVSLEDARGLLGSGFSVSKVILTHGHFDHFIELSSYTRGGAELYASREAADAIKDADMNLSRWICGREFEFNDFCNIVAADDIITVGSEVMRVIETPGHTKGSICLLGSDFIFSGDTLFASGGYGRSDLPGGNAGELAKSLEKLLSLDGDLKLYSGHGEASTVKETKSFF